MLTSNIVVNCFKKIDFARFNTYYNSSDKASVDLLGYVIDVRCLGVKINDSSNQKSA